jgi:hypothetical protein
MQHTEQDKLPLWRISKGERHRKTDIKCGDETHYSTEPSAALVTGQAKLQLPTLRMGSPVRVERPAPVKTEQARDGLHPLASDDEDDYRIIFIIFGFHFLEELIIKMLVLWGCDVMYCGVWELMPRRSLLTTSSG